MSKMYSLFMREHEVEIEKTDPLVPCLKYDSGFLKEVSTVHYPLH